MGLNEYLNERGYLPERFRDFHDQKELFKYIFHKIEIPKELSHLSWVDGHIFTIDIFLWFMAKRGYVLRKSRHHINFIDIDTELDEFRELLDDRFAKIIGLTPIGKDDPQTENAN